MAVKSVKFRCKKTIFQLFQDLHIITDNSILTRATRIKIDVISWYPGCLGKNQTVLWDKRPRYKEPIGYIIRRSIASEKLGLGKCRQKTIKKHIQLCTVFRPIISLPLRYLKHISLETVPFNLFSDINATGKYESI